jgi:hypothetical protein
MGIPNCTQASHASDADEDKEKQPEYSLSRPPLMLMFKSERKRKMKCPRRNHIGLVNYQACICMNLQRPN